jgi:uncharacterized NAD-dependent epimerase/dehydratase family protein
MTGRPDGTAIVYCDRAFATTNGKTAHGLVRHTRRYRVAAVIDRDCAGRDAGEVLDGKRRDIPVQASLEAAIRTAAARAPGGPATHFVIGVAPDGGRMDAGMREAVLAAIRHGLAVDAGLHDFLGDDPEIVRTAHEHGVRLRDVRKPPPRDQLHFFSGKIRDVAAHRIAVLGTDSAVGKRTTAWCLVDALVAAGLRAELVGTGQTAWMQGARYGVVLDALVNDFVTGEIEHAIWECWTRERPDAIVLEGQGSLLHPAYPGGFELIAAGKPGSIVLQHAPGRRCYDGFPDEPLHPLERQIRAVELIADAPVVAVTLNPEGLADEAARGARREIEAATGRPALDVLAEGAGRLVEALRGRIARQGAAT